VNGKEKYIASKAYKRPVGSFTQRDNVRDFARSGHGQNYHKMMDLHQQLPTMTKDDPRVQEFKDRRRSFNRYGKYPMGEMLGMSPLDMQKKYVGLSRDVRQTNKPVYNKMYPIEGGYMDYTQGGGLPGLILKGAKSLVGNIVGMGRDILGGDGINGADRDVSQKELDDYAAKTFGFYPSDVHPGLPIEDETSLVDEKTREEQIQELVDEEQRKIDNFETDYHSDLLDDMAKDQWPTSGYRFEFDDYVQDRMDALRNAPPDDTYVAPPDDIEPLPFDEGREDFIRRQNEYVIPEPIFPGNVRQDDPYETSAYEKWYNERLNNRLADQYQEWGPHYREPVTSYYGSNWYDEYKRKLENEMEIAKGIRSPMDR